LRRAFLSGVCCIGPVVLVAALNELLLLKMLGCGGAALMLALLA
jgi:hypothetical protein